MAFRFLQVSDVHLGSRVNLRWLSQTQRDAVAECVSASFRAAMTLAREHEVHAVLIPGDLFDDDAVAPRHVSWAVSCFRSIAPIPVFIAPGNHDPCWPGSPYHAGWAERYPEMAWPDNVHIFTQPHFETFTSPGGEFCITGIAHTRAGTMSERLIAGDIPRADAAARVLLFHGSREFEGAPGKEKTLPFTDAELERQGFDWAAIGHYHAAALIENAKGEVIGGYSGCPQGRGLDECGEGVALVGTLDDGRVEIERVPVSARRFWSLEVPVDGRGLPEVMEAVEAAASEAAGEDLVHVKLTGRAPRELDFTFPQGFLSRLFAFHCDRSALMPDYDLDALAASDGLPGRFVRRIREMSAAGPARADLCEAAILMGLDAIHDRTVSFPDEN
jgi:hypothetical protein